MESEDLRAALARALAERDSAREELALVAQLLDEMRAFVVSLPDRVEEKARAALKEAIARGDLVVVNKSAQ